MRSRPKPEWRAILVLLAVSTSLTIRAERLPIKSYTTADGLPHDQIVRIVADSRGFVWFCTKGGLARFDGYSFTKFGVEEGLPPGGVNDLLETRSRELWVATDSGLVRFLPTGRPANASAALSQNATPPMFEIVGPAEPEDRFSQTITVLREGHDGTIWAGTRRGLYRLEGSGSARTLRPVEIGLPGEFPEEREIGDVHEDRFGTLWVSSPSGLYRRWSDGSSARYSAHDGLPGSYLQNVFEDHSGRFWAATRGAGFFAFTADETHRAPVIGVAFSTKEGSPGNWVNQIFETRDRRFWIAGDGGLTEFFPGADARGERFNVFTPRNGLTDYVIQSVTEDLAGNLWLSSTRVGAMKLSRDGFISYGREEGIDRVDTVFRDRAGDLCFKGYVLGDAGGTVFEGRRLDVTGAEPRKFTRIGCFDGRRFDWFEPPAVADWGWVLERTTLQARNGEFWLGTALGLLRFAARDHFTDLKTARPIAVYTARDGLTAPQISRLFEDSAGNIWISATSAPTQSLARWDARTERILDLGSSAGLPSLREERPRSFGEDASHNIWIGFGSGLARYRNGAFTFFTSAQGLPPGGIQDVHLDHAGRLWLASERAGLIRVDQADAAIPTFVSYTTTQGLSSNDEEVIIEDASGFLYTGGGQGIDRFDPQTGRVKHFTAADGLAPGILAAGFCDRDGVLWFGTSTGLLRLVPRTDATAATGPRTLISAVRVAGLSQTLSALGEESLSLGDLSPTQSEIEVDFVALSFRAGEVLRYQYKLEGGTTDWSAATDLRTVNLASLAPGTYRFLVRAVNSDGATSGAPAALAFRILQPIWLRWWFLALAAMVVGAGVLASYRYRVARVLELAAIRARIATDLHDDIGANLTRISLLSEVAKQKSSDPSLGSIGAIARESVGAMSDIVWAINPNNESLADLISRMRRHAEELFTLREIDLTFNTPDAHDAVRLPMDVRRDLLLVFKEAANNAARHSRCTRVSIDLFRTGSKLVLVVADDGVGFDTSRDSAGHGLASLRRRAERLNGTLEVRSGPLAGTTVTLQISVTPTRLRR